MNATKLLIFSILVSANGSLCAQNPADALIEPVKSTTDASLSPDLPAISLEPSIPQGADPAPSPEIAPTKNAPNTGVENQKLEMGNDEEGFIIKDAPLNDIFQFLCKNAGRQYFHNAKIAGSEYAVTGHLNDGNPLTQMEDLAFMYGLSLHTKGNTVYALTQAQLAQLPSMEFHYQLRYLRPTDIEQIKELIKPVLSPGTGIVNFEPKTNTIIIIDSAHRIEQARNLLRGIDKVQGQIIVETKILRVNSGAGEYSGVNWSQSLGETGTSLTIARDLNAVFGLPDSIASTIDGSGGTNLVLSPVELTGVLRALNEGNLARQVSNPTLITEDNEIATISIIDRVPIITTTSTQATSGGNPTVTEEVRYKIDTSDKSIDESPDKHREIGISVMVTPTLLPDGTIRMKLRPRSAQITGIVEGVGTKDRAGNKYPRVTESMVETLARVPDGHSLVVGGFYGESEERDRNKVPLLGDVPMLNFFFKSKETKKEQTSLVFIVTPKSYNPTNVGANRGAHDLVRGKTVIDCDHDWIDPENPGPAHEPNMRRSIRAMTPTQAPYYPRIGEPTAAPVTDVAPNRAKSPKSKVQFSRASRL